MVPLAVVAGMTVAEAVATALVATQVVQGVLSVRDWDKYCTCNECQCKDCNRQIKKEQ